MFNYELTLNWKPSISAIDRNNLEDTVLAIIYTLEPNNNNNNNNNNTSTLLYIFNCSFILMCLDIF